MSVLKVKVIYWPLTLAQGHLHIKLKSGFSLKSPGKSKPPPWVGDHLRLSSYSAMLIFYLIVYTLT